MTIEQVSQNTQEIITTEQLEDLLKSGRPLNVKLGVDPTSPDLHLGHAVVLRKLKQFQDAGHQTYLVIGDFTAGIGDPAGVNKTRPVLTETEIRHNMDTYLAQAGKVIDLDKTHIVYNSEWLKTMNLSQFIGYAMQLPVTELIEREDFANRLGAHQPVGLHELLYPVVQAIDSVHLKADVEIGGVDQRLNLLLARELQKKLGMPPQTVILAKLLIGTDGTKKMSKSQGNYIGLEEPPSQMFGKLMRLPDDLINEYAESHAVTLDPQDQHPRSRKAAMARGIVTEYYGAVAAENAATAFDRTFRDREVSEQLVKSVVFNDDSVTLIQVVAQATGSSSSEARRLIEQKAIKLNSEIVEDPIQKVRLGDQKVLLQVGKHRFYELEYK